MHPYCGMTSKWEAENPLWQKMNLKMDIVARRGGLRGAPSREYRDKPILREVTHADQPAKVHLRGGSGGQDGSAVSVSEARKCQHYGRTGHVSFDERGRKLLFSPVESVHKPGRSRSRSQ